MIIRLKRYSYGEFETEGTLFVGDRTFATIEQPWTPNPKAPGGTPIPGGKPFESCIPDGMYRLEPWTRPNGDEVYIISNAQLGVHLLPSHHTPGEGRDLCLIHKANFASEIQGCIAPGHARGRMFDDGEEVQAVKHSGDAMNDLRELLGDEQHILSIEHDAGPAE